MLTYLFAAIGSCVFSSLWQPVDAMAYAPNHFFGTCLTQSWVESMEQELGISSKDRDDQGRLVHPFLHAALSTPRFRVEDPRMTAPGVYAQSCTSAAAGTIYGTGATVAQDGTVLDQGEINGTLILELNGWATHSLVTDVFAILASEIYGYQVSFYSLADYNKCSERMSSHGDGACTPTHANLEVWPAGIQDLLDRFPDEAAPVGEIGYFGRSGIYTTTDFINDALNTTKYPGGPYYANFWQDYTRMDELIEAVSAADFFADTQYYDLTVLGSKYCKDGSFGCQNSCSRTKACTDRLNNYPNSDCLVVVMMFDYYSPGQVQAVFANLGIPAYFCFIGYGKALEYAVYMQEQGKPVLFYHYEPDLFWYKHPEIFDRLFLPQYTAEGESVNTATFGENGYGEQTDNPVKVDMPFSRLKKYSATRLINEVTAGSNTIGPFLSRIAFTDLDMDSMLKKYTNASDDTNDPDPVFSVSCDWVKTHYIEWKTWLARLPLCTFDDHVQYEITGCDDSTSDARSIIFSWGVPNPENESLPYVCDGGLASYPAPLVTSRSCEWLYKSVTTWVTWITKKPTCDFNFLMYNITQCDASSKRTVNHYWLLPDPTNSSKSLECTVEGGMSLPESVQIDCEYMPFESPIFITISILCSILVGIMVLAMLFVFINRNAPIIKRSQYQLLELIIVGGIVECGSALAYAGKPSDLLCGLRPVLASFGFTTIFGALVVKSLRVYRVFMRTAMKRVTVSIVMMLKVLAVFYLVDLVIIVAWFAIDFPLPRVELVPSTAFGGQVDHIRCKSNSFIFSALLIFWKAIVLFLGLYMSFLIRNVSSDFQESIWIFASAVTVLIGSIVILPLAYLVDMAASAFYVFLSGSLLLCTTIVMALMLVPKVLRLHAVSNSSTSSKNSISASKYASRGVIPKQEDNSDTTQLGNPSGKGTSSALAKSTQETS